MMKHRVQGPIAGAHCRSQGPTTGAHCCSQGPTAGAHCCSQGPTTEAHSSKGLHPDGTEVCGSEPKTCCCSGPCSSCGSSSGSSCGSSSRGPCDFSRSLPPELTEQIFLRLDPRSLCRAAQTCRRWHHIIQDSEALWRGQCGLLRAHCGREVDQDRSHGHSWKDTLVRNFDRDCLKRDWLRGRFSRIHSANELRDVRMVPFDAEAWGEILEAELDR